ncbi:MAG: biotin/lipoate A/B protein ligase family protein [Aggregatilineales bacterium]
MRQWHLIYDSPTTGARNMAIDEAILENVSSGALPPTLRFYGWNPPCLSLGYGQRAADVAIDALRDRGWEIVRRLTGGKGILHIDELTYSLAIPADEPIAEGGIIESYRRISEALLAGLNLLGVQSNADKKAEGLKTIGPVCFETPSHYEITTPDGRKLVGSAQVRRKNGVLQHGSLPLAGDIARICDTLKYPNAYHREEAKFHVRERATTLEQALGQYIKWQTAADAIRKGFENVFDVQFDVVNSDDVVPTLMIDRLVAEVYGNPEKTFRL